MNKNYFTVVNLNSLCKIKSCECYRDGADVGVGRVRPLYESGSSDHLVQGLWLRPQHPLSCLEMCKGEKASSSYSVKKVQIKTCLHLYNKGN